MTIDTNELRLLTQAALAGPDGVSLNWIKLLQDFQQKASPAVISELLDRLEAAEKDIALKERVIDALGSELNAVANERLEAVEKERDALRSLVVMRFDHDHPPQFTQGYEPHELNEPVTAEHCRWFVAEIERLRAEVAHIKEVEFPRKAQAVADGWRGKCERLEAKITEMERQEPVAFALYSGWAFKAAYHKEHEACDQRDRRQLSADLGGSLEAYRVVPLYALPGAQPAPIEMSITTGALSEMFLSLDGYDKAQPGYEWRKGWNDAIRQAMDYAQPAPSGVFGKAPKPEGK